MGPPMDEYWNCCWERQREWFTVVWITSPLLGAIALFISIRQLVSLGAAPITCFRQTYIHCAAFPIVMTFCTLLVVMTSPRSEPVSELLKSLYEGFVLFGFGSLLFQMLALESAGSRTVNTTLDREEDDESAEQEVGDRIVKAIKEQGTRKHFATFPLCCCLGCFMREHYLSGVQLLVCIFMLQQYMLIVPGTSIFLLWTALVVPKEYHRMHIRSIYVQKFSQLTALWGLFVLYRASVKLLKKWRTSQKFLSLKIIVLIQILQRPLVSSVVKHLVPKLYPDNLYCLSHDFMIDAMNSWLLLGWCVMLAILISRAFPVKEVMNEDASLYIPGMFDIDIKRHVQSTRRSSSRRSSSHRSPSSFMSSRSSSHRSLSPATRGMLADEGEDEPAAVSAAPPGTDKPAWSSQCKPGTPLAVKVISGPHTGRLGACHGGVRNARVVYDGHEESDFVDWALLAPVDEV